MTASQWALLVPVIVAFLTALTALIRAELSVKVTKATKVAMARNAANVMTVAQALDTHTHPGKNTPGQTP